MAIRYVYLSQHDDVVVIKPSIAVAGKIVFELRSYESNADTWISLDEWEKIDEAARASFAIGKTFS